MFRAELMQQPWRETPEEREALLIWLSYYVSTEEFDRTMPGAFSRFDPDSWMPLPHYHGNMVAFAREARANALAKQAEAGIGRDVFENARRQVSEMSYKSQVDLLKSLQNG